MIDWHKDSRSQHLLAQLDVSRVERVKRVSVPADFHEYVGADRDARRIFKLLEARRTRAIERALGCSFDAACADRSRRNEIIAVLEAAPDVSLVIEEALR
ncbi:MAG: hypothetical protein PWP11_3274 [Thauera sp.]|nr:hypothetical protein [Thauera sp.]MDI3491997.1 hypothetical protein [Thauera sp.]